jgi:pseudouridine-5'-phosphate glycosidase
VRGGAVTPLLVSALDGATGGRALAANLALLEANARLGASVAMAVRAATEAEP